MYGIILCRWYLRVVKDAKESKFITYKRCYTSSAPFCEPNEPLASIEQAFLHKLSIDALGNLEGELRFNTRAPMHVLKLVRTTPGKLH